MRIHIVQKGDTLWKIARQYGISFEDLKRLNAHLANPDYIVPGMEIILPTASVKEVPRKQQVKEHVVKEQVKEGVKQQHVKEWSVKERPVKEQPVKEMPRPPIQPSIPVPLPQPIPIPQQPLSMPIELHWTQQMPQVQPAQPMQIDFFNLLQMPDVNVQMDIPQAPPFVMPQPTPLPQPIPEPQHITHYVHVPVPVPVPHVVHPPCGCHARPQPRHCGCGGHRPPMHHQPWPMPLPATPWSQESTDVLGEQQIPQQYPTQIPFCYHDGQQPQLPMIDAESEQPIAGWRFPESSSCSSSIRPRRHGIAGIGHKENCKPQVGDVGSMWQQAPMHAQMPQQNPMYQHPMPGCGCHQQIMPYEHGWPQQPPFGGSQWMMPYT